VRPAVSLFIIIVVSAIPIHAQKIGAGTTINVRIEQSITTKSAGAGDAVLARVSKPLRDGNTIVAPAGTTLEGKVDFVQPGSVTEDGWMRLLFNRVNFPDGRQSTTLASASFRTHRRKGPRNHLLAMTALAAAGIAVAGPGNRTTGGLGGAIAGFVLVENRQRYGRDIMLHAGATIRVKLAEDLR